MIANQLILNGIIAGSIYALVALGFTVIYRTVKFLHIPEQSGHPNRTKVDSESGAKWTPIPEQSGQ